MKTSWKPKPDMDINCRYVDVADGIRGISVLLVLWFHFWQQTWLMPSYPTPFLEFLGIRELTPCTSAGWDTCLWI